MTLLVGHVMVHNPINPRISMPPKPGTVASLKDREVGWAESYQLLDLEN